MSKIYIKPEELEKIYPPESNSLGRYLLNQNTDITRELYSCIASIKDQVSSLKADLELEKNAIKEEEKEKEKEEREAQLSMTHVLNADINYTLSEDTLKDDLNNLITFIKRHEDFLNFSSYQIQLINSTLEKFHNDWLDENSKGTSDFASNIEGF